MPNEYGTEETYKVYQIRGTGQVGNFENVYGLVFAKTADSREEAETWIKEHGDRHVEYTIIESFRNK